MISIRPSLLRDFSSPTRLLSFFRGGSDLSLPVPSPLSLSVSGAGEPFIRFWEPGLGPWDLFPFPSLYRTHVRGVGGGNRENLSSLPFRFSLGRASKRQGGGVLEIPSRLLSFSCGGVCGGGGRTIGISLPPVTNLLALRRRWNDGLNILGMFGWGETEDRNSVLLTW